MLEDKLEALKREIMWSLQVVMTTKFLLFSLGQPTVKLHSLPSVPVEKQILSIDG